METDIWFEYKIFLREFKILTHWYTINKLTVHGIIINKFFQPKVSLSCKEYYGFGKYVALYKHVANNIRILDNQVMQWFDTKAKGNWLNVAINPKINLQKPSCMPISYFKSLFDILYWQT